jgi:hypothetical protein
MRTRFPLPLATPLLERHGAQALVLDTFTGDNGTSLASHAPEVHPPGSAWVVTQGSIVLNDNRIGPVYPGHAWIEAGRADVRLSCQLKVATATCDNGLAGRGSASGACWAATIVKGSPNRLAIQERNHPTYVERASTPVTALEGRLVFSLDGSLLQAELDGQSASYASATFNQSVTRHGVKLGDPGAAAYLDDFKVEAL